MGWLGRVGLSAVIVVALLTAVSALTPIGPAPTPSGVLADAPAPSVTPVSPDPTTSVATPSPDPEPPAVEGSAAVPAPTTVGKAPSSKVKDAVPYEGKELPSPTTRSKPPRTQAPAAPRTQAPAAPRTQAPAPPAPPAPSGSGSSAAERFGWGAVVDGDEFNGSALDRSKWTPYDGPGHDGQGRRTPSAFSVSGGALQIRGDSAGNTGGMSFGKEQKFGRWETRIRVPVGDPSYSAVSILWPQVIDFPLGGEVDYFETRTDEKKTSFFLHYSAQNRQTSASRNVDITQWHNYAVEWTSSCITGFMDGVEWFKDCEASHLPPGPMAQTLQLDWFPEGGSVRESFMFVDYVRMYRP